MKREIARRTESVDQELEYKELEKQIEEIRIYNLQNLEPTLTTYNKMLKIVEDFIKINKNIVYGGTAIEKYLRLKDSEVIAQKDPNKIIDYDFYSFNNERDSIIIANDLFKAGFKYSRRIQAKHEGTLRVSAEFTREFVADVTFIPKEVFGKLKCNEIEGILYLDPQILKIDLYESITNPHRNVFRLEKSFNRLSELERFYPIQLEKVPEKKLKLDKKLIEYSKNMILTGVTAFNLYTASNYDSVYEFYSLDPLEDSKKLKIKNGKYKKFNQFLYFQNDFVELEVDSKPIARWYSFGTDCISINKINGQKVVNKYWLLRFMYTKNFINHVEGITENYYPFYILELLKMPREELQLDCLSIEDESEILDFKLDFLNRKKNRNIYKPESEIKNPEGIVTEYHHNLLMEEIN